LLYVKYKRQNTKLILKTIRSMEPNLKINVLEINVLFSILKNYLKKCLFNRNISEFS